MRRVCFRSGLFFVLAGSLFAGQRLSDRLASLRGHAPGLPRIHFGYKVIDADTGETIASDRSAELFTPASNNKLFTTAFALMKLGPDYRFTTELRTHASLDPAATMLPDLEFIGGGDPNLSGRVLPYRPQETRESEEGDPLRTLRDLAHQLKQRGIVSVNGDVTGVASRYGVRYPVGWAIDDVPFGYGAPVTSLAVNDNTIVLSLQPTEDGELADIQLRPATPHFMVLNDLLTTANGKTALHMDRPLGSNEVIVWGTIAGSSAEIKEDLAVEDPALFAAECLRDAVEDEGITVRGETRANYRNPTETAELPLAGIILAKHDSATVAEIVQVTNKVSQNLHSEMLLQEAALTAGPAADGLMERQRFLDSVGITREGVGYDASDGSGVARQDKASPDAIAALLRFMWQSRLKDVWLASLPIGGEDGSLKSRFTGVAGANGIHAKTGSLRHVNTLGGYVQAKSGRWLAFSLMADDTLASDADVRVFLDSFCAAMLEE